MSWLKLDLEVVDAHADAVGDLLLGLGASAASVTPAQASVPEVFEPDPGATPLWQLCRLSALLPLDADFAEVQARLAPYAARVLDTGFLQDGDWLEGWRQHAVHECFAGRLWLLPRDAGPQSGPCVRLNPGLAFGTGSHPTTRLCLEWLAATDMSGKSVLDYGCGSGVLGLAACALGAAHVVAVDHDAQALQATRDNAAFNGFVSRLTVGEADVCLQDRYDVVLANILARPLIDLAPRLVGLLKPGGYLVLSGLLHEQAPEVMTAYAGVGLAGHNTDDGWMCLVGRRA